MKILVISNLYPPHYLGGYELRCQLAVEGLRQRGHKVLVVTSDYRGERSNAQSDEPDVYRWLAFRFLPPHDKTRQCILWLRYLRDITRVRKLVRMEAPDVVFVWNLGDLFRFLPVAVISWGIPSTFVFDDDWALPWKRPRRFRDFLKFLYGYFDWLHKVDFAHATFVSQFRKQQYIEAGYPANSARVIYGGIPVAKFFADRTKTESIGTLRFLYLGRICDAKGVRDALDAFVQLLPAMDRSVSLTIAGESTRWDEDCVRYISSTVKRSNIAPHVNLVGRIAYADVPRLYQTHDVFVFSSRITEGFPLTILEAMASGLAVISTATGGNREILQHGVNCLVYKSGNIPELAAYMKQLAENDDFRVQLAKQGQNQVCHDFDIAHMTDEFEHLLQQTTHDFSNGHQKGKEHPEFSEPLYIDITHTYGYPVTSGIQRVVKELIVALDELHLPFELFIIHDENICIQLTSEQKASFIAQYKASKAGKVRNRTSHIRIFARMVFQMLKAMTVALTPLWPSLGEQLNNILVWIKRILLKKPLSGSILHFTRNSKILIPELCEPKCVRTYQHLKANTHAQLTAIVHDFIPFQIPEHHADIAGFANATILYRHIDKAICVSKSVANDLSHFYALIEPLRTNKASVKIATQTHGTNLKSRTVPTSKPWPSTFLFIVVGTLEPRKNHIRMVKAVEQARKQTGLDIQLKLFGHKGWLDRDIYNTIQQLDPQHQFCQLRHGVPDAELDTTYRQAHASLFCSLLEGFGLPILESLAHKVPCITSNIGSMKEIADTYGGCIQVSPHSVDDIAQAIVNLCTQPELHKKLIDELQDIKLKTWKDYATEVFNYAKQ